MWRDPTCDGVRKKLFYLLLIPYLEVDSYIHSHKDFSVYRSLLSFLTGCTSSIPHSLDLLSKGKAVSSTLHKRAFYFISRVSSAFLYQFAVS